MRIVSLLPSATELLGVLGLEDSLVAISHECDTPASVLHLPHATRSRIPEGLSQSEINALVAQSIQDEEPLYAVDAGLIRDLAPDLVVTQGLCDVCAVTPDTIEASLRGIACTLPASTRVLSLNGMSVDGIFADLQALASATNTQQAASTAIADSRAQLASIATAAAPRRVLLLEWVDPAYSPGHWVPEQVEAAGCISVIGAPGDHSRALPWSEIEAASPEAIGVICCGYGLDENVSFAQMIAEKPEVQRWLDGPIVAFDANRFFSRPTLAIVEGARRLHEAFVLGSKTGDGFRTL